MIVMCVLGAALIYPYGFTSGRGIYAAAFFEQLCITGVWGIVPIYLIKVSPAAFRTFVVGTSYQIGVLIASPCNTIVEHIGLRYPLPSAAGSAVQHYDYRVPICSLTGCTLVYVIVMAAIGPEKRGHGMAEVDSDDSDIELPVSRITRVPQRRF